MVILPRPSRFLLLLLFGLWAVVLPGCSPQPASPLKVAIHPWIGYQSLTLCQQEGLLNENLVSLQASPSLSDSSKMVLDGRVDGAALTLDEVLALRDKGVALTVVLVFDASAGADLLVSRPEISRLDQLAGKRLGLEDSVLGKLMLSEILLRGGLQQDELELHYGIVSEHAKLWQQGKLDALITYLPLPKEVAQNSHRLFDSHDIPNTILDVLAIRTDRLERYRPALEHLLAQHFAIVDRLRSNAPDTIHRLAPLLNMSVPETEAALREIIYPALAYNQQLLRDDDSGQVLKTTLKLAPIMMESGLLGAPPVLSGMVDRSFLPQAAR